MRVRIQYSKQGLLKFIGHLDMMRCFQKLLRRAGVDVTFSEGYSPHMVMSYAFPLGVGMTSDSEYVDVDLNRAYSSRELVSLLNEAAPEGLHVLDAREVPLGKGNKGMTLVARADYTL
ncbi:MAG TPA: Fe-S oxidoreductase, partial [Lachnospiraceae bacterium]|nr:Fe-S oxidoreductase [Lachnospiraceae bacterium]